MDSKSQELYAEEQRTLLIELNKGISALLEKYEAPRDFLRAEISNDAINVSVDNELLKVNLENEKDLEPILNDVAKTIAKAIKDNTVTEVSVKGLDKLKPHKEVKINNLANTEKLLGALLDKDWQIKIKQEAPKFPILAKEAIPVRLSDGKAFYKAQFSSSVASGVAEADPLVGYQPSDKDKSSDPKYWGFLKKDGAWYIMEENIANGTYRYAVGTPQPRGGGLYTDAWTDRANLSYGYFDEVFNA